MKRIVFSFAESHIPDLDCTCTLQGLYTDAPGKYVCREMPRHKGMLFGKFGWIYWNVLTIRGKPGSDSHSSRP